MPSVSVQCPHCSQSYSLDGSVIGRKGRCKNCGNWFALHPVPEVASGFAALVSAEAAGSSADRGSTPSGPPPPTVTQPISLPERISRFVIQERLGEGAFGTVYRAIDPVLEREVALKVSRAGPLEDPASAERFLREARAAAKLRHPHIVTVFETGVDRGACYIASQLIRGKTLASGIDEGNIDARSAAGIVADLADALQCAHAQGIVHRDLKPANVMIDVNGQAYLMDFGLARIAGSGDQKLTAEGDVVGTPAYMSPEQAAGDGTDAGPAGDQYSLGVTLFELLAGETPFCGVPEIVIFHLLHSAPPAVRDLKPAVPSELDAICRKALAKLPADRYASCGEFADDLRRFLRAEPIAAGRPLVPPQRRRAWVGLLVGLAATAAIATALAVWIARRAPSGVEHAAPLATAVNPAPDRSEPEVAAGTLSPPSRRSPSSVVAPVVANLPEVKPTDTSRVAGLSQPPPAGERPNAEANAAAKAQSPAPTAKAEKKPDRAASLTYDQRIQAAYDACQANDGDRARAILASCPPDARGWEWYYCQRQSRGGLTTRPGNGTVATIAYSPDGKSLAVCDGVDVGVFVSGDPRWKRIGTQPLAARVAFSADGSRILSLDSANVLKEWDVASASSVRSFDLPLAKATASALCHDGHFFAAGSASGTVKVWASEDAKELASQEVQSAVQSMEFSADGRKILVTVRDGVRVLDWRGATPKTSKPRLGGARGLAISPDGRFIATSGADSAVTVHDVSARRDTYVLRGHTASVLAASFSHDGKQLATGGRDRTLMTWDLATGRLLGSYQGHRTEIRSIRFSPDDRRLAASTNDGSIREWRVRDGFSEKEFAVRGMIDHLSFADSGKKLFVLSQYTTTVRRVHTGPPPRFARHGFEIKFTDPVVTLFDSEYGLAGAPQTGILGLSPDLNKDLQPPDGHLVVTDVIRDVPLIIAAVQNALVAMNVAREREVVQERFEEQHSTSITVLDNHRCYVHKAAAPWTGVDVVGLPPDASFHGVWDRIERGWLWFSKADEKPGHISVLPGTENLVCIVKPEPENWRIQPEMRIIAAGTGQVVSRVPGSSYRIHPRGNLVAVVQKMTVNDKPVNSVVTLWDPRQTEPLAQFPGEHCSFDPSGRLLATWASGSATIRDWATKQEVGKFETSGSSIAFSPDGRRIVAALGNQVHILEAATGKLLLKLPGPSDNFVFSPDGRMIASGTDNMARFWIADPPSSQADAR